MLKFSIMQIENSEFLFGYGRVEFSHIIIINLASAATGHFHIVLVMPNTTSSDLILDMNDE